MFQPIGNSYYGLYAHTAMSQHEPTVTNRIVHTVCALFDLSQNSERLDMHGGKREGAGRKAK